MRKKSVLLLTVLCVALLCGCGKTETLNSNDPVSQEQPSGKEQQPGKDQADGVGQAQENDGQDTGDDGADGEQETADGTDADGINVDGINADGSDEGDSDAEEPVALSDEELQFFTEFIQNVENYGFLLSAYDAPKDVDLGEVFYSGAGIGEPMSEEEITAYLAAYEQEELYTDCVKIPAQAMEAFLQRKLGVGLEDIPDAFNWRYLQEYDAYYHEAGDTNYASYDCVEGVRQGELYTLRFQTDWLLDDPRSDCETVLRKNGDDYQFVSNRYLGEGESANGAGDPRVRAAYAEALQDLLDNWIMPDGRQVEPDPFWVDRPNENDFCIADVDGDGREELLVALTTVSMADMREVVYEYDPDTGEMRREFQEYPDVTYFDNGMVLARWSDNHTYGEDFWPYHMYRYDADSDEYLYVGCVTSWQKTFHPEGYPDDVDVLGTGTVYSVSDGCVEDFCYDQQQYDEFYEETFGAANEVELQWHLLIEEELELLLTGVSTGDL